MIWSNMIKENMSELDRIFIMEKLEEIVVELPKTVSEYKFAHILPKYVPVILKAFWQVGHVLHLCGNLSGFLK